MDETVGEHSTMDSSRHRLESLIRDDPVATELKVALFASALASYRRDSLLRPFPPRFKEEASDGDSKNFSLLEKLVSSLPSWSELSDGSSLDALSPDTVDLLLWVLTQRSVALKSVGKDLFEKELLPRVGKQSAKVPMPDFVLECQYAASAEQRFQEERTKQGVSETLLAFHGSRLAHFHSILHHGLVSHLNKTSAFGEGTYLSQELAVSLHWSPASQPGLPMCSLGDNMSCVALCEVIPSSPGVLLDQDDTRPDARGGFSLNRQRPPEKYMIVKNDDLVRVKFLLLYASPSDRSRQSLRPSSSVGQLRSGESRAAPSESAMEVSWLMRYRFWLCMGAYFVLLTCVGLGNSRHLKSYLNRWKLTLWGTSTYQTSLDEH